MPEYPRVQVVIRVGEQVFDADAYPDTGFSGGIAVPAGLRAEFDQAPRRGRLWLGDARPVDAFYWARAVAIASESWPTHVWAIGNDYLVGREILDRLEVCFEFGEHVRMKFDKGS